MKEVVKNTPFQVLVLAKEPDNVDFGSTCLYLSSERPQFPLRRYKSQKCLGHSGRLQQLSANHSILATNPYYAVYRIAYVTEDRKSRGKQLRRSKRPCKFPRLPYVFADEFDFRRAVMSPSIKVACPKTSQGGGDRLAARQRACGSPCVLSRSSHSLKCCTYSELCT
ncbi:hypothetical protein DL98DRAFT_518988 [Cadophora sp. DSE1049]|nr:hypothetical protein DL98DRAFT_518988 [Cadophora sp. DSE1049]